MAYLHRQNIIHRDLKPSNILLDENLTPKIADFGLSKNLLEKDYIEFKNPKSSGFKGSYAYSAPEVLETLIYTKEGDIYAFGMIVYEIITNEILYENLNQIEILKKIIKGDRPEFKFLVPYCYRKLIEKCWNENSSYRPSFEDIVIMLETDKRFITSNVNEQEYLDYISLIKGDENQNNDINTNANKPINVHSNNAKKVSFGSNHTKLIENDYKEIYNECFLDLTKFQRKEIINKSGFYKIYKIEEIDTGKIYAGQISMRTIKRISNEDVNKIESELKIIKKLKHPSLLKFIGYSQCDFKNQRKPVIVTELALNGSLANILKIERMNNSVSGWDETKKLMCIYGIASGMSYLHSFNILHRSLNTENIFLDEILTPKIGDFGLSSFFSFSDSITQQSISGVKSTSINLAPEVLESNKYSKSSDVYSFAFVVYEIIMNEIPFKNEINNKNQFLDSIKNNKNRPTINETIPKSYNDLIEKCWSQNPGNRPTFKEIVNLLKNDLGFITDKIRNEDYQKYINRINNFNENV